MLKKYSPIIAIILLFLGFFVGQTVFDLENLSALPAKKDKNTIAVYEKVFSKTTFVDMKGKSYKLKDLKAPIVILNFWASWCRPCLEEFPSIVKMKKKFSDSEIAVFAINSDDENITKNIKKTAKKFKFNFPVISKNSNKHYEDFMITSIPVSLIFHKGKVIQVTNGAHDFFAEEVLENFKSLLKK